MPIEMRGSGTVRIETTKQIMKEAKGSRQTKESLKLVRRAGEHTRQANRLRHTARRMKASQRLSNAEAKEANHKHNENAMAAYKRTAEKMKIPVTTNEQNKDDEEIKQAPLEHCESRDLLDASELKEKLKVIERELQESHEMVTRVDLLNSIHAATLERIAAKHIGIRSQINDLIKACNTKET